VTVTLYEPIASSGKVAEPFESEEADLLTPVEDEVTEIVAPEMEFPDALITLAFKVPLVPSSAKADDPIVSTKNDKTKPNSFDLVI
jgi:hypothetical protein